MPEMLRTTGSGSWRISFNRNKVANIVILNSDILFCSTCSESNCYHLSFTDAINKEEFDALKTESEELKKKLDLAEKKLKKLSVEKRALENSLSEKDIELESLKVKCDELEEREETLQKDLDDATKGSAILDSEILGNYLFLRYTSSEIFMCSESLICQYSPLELQLV
jgi:Uncharacterized protein containing TOPRIM domain, potential nuclease